MKRIWTFRLILAVILFRQEAFASEGDVYNFYFQKAPGPTTVIQGGGKPQNSVQVRETPNGVEVIQPNKEENPAPSIAPPTTTTTATKEKEVEKEPEFKKWSVRFGSEAKSQDLEDDYLSGYSWETNRMTVTGTAIGATYAFNKYLALDGTLLFASNAIEARYPKKSMSAKGVFPYLGVEFTPVRLTIFSFDLLDISLMAGLTTKGLSRESNETSTYTGFKLGLNLSTNFGVQVVARFTPDSNTGEGGVNAIWRF